MTTDPSPRAKRLVDLALEVVGNTGASIGGFLIGGVPGALFGGSIGPIAVRIFRDFAERGLSTREARRIGAAAISALQRFEAIRGRGETPRSDFVPQDHEEQTAEFFEGILQAARTANEQKKVRHLGNIFGTFAFAQGVSIEDATLALGVVERVSYRQLVILEVVRSERNRTLRVQDYRGIPVRLTQSTLLQEVYELVTLGLLQCQEPGNSTAEFLLGYFDVKPAHLKVTHLGQLVGTLAGTEEIDEAEFASVTDLLA